MRLAWAKAAGAFGAHGGVSPAPSCGSPIGSLMPRYFFDIADHEVVCDDDGTELPNDDAARGEAVIFAGAYLKDHPELAWDGREMRVHVFAEPRRPLFVVLVIGIDLARPEVEKPS